MPPSEEQKTKLIETLDAMPRDQWTATVRWMIDRIVADDQQMATTILWREASRRMEKANQFQSDEKRKRTADDCLVEVLRDVGARLVVV